MIAKTETMTKAKATKILQGHSATAEELVSLATRLSEEQEFLIAIKLLLKATKDHPGEKKITKALTDHIARWPRNLPLKAEFTEAEVQELVPRLQADLQFGTARGLLEYVFEMGIRGLWFAQQRAICTYKDEDLPVWERYDKALAILNEHAGLADPSAREPETLCLAGAVYKRMWEYRGRIDHLYDSLSFYRESYEKYPKADLGYGGVNAAFILKILASRLRAIAARTQTVSKEAQILERQAQDIYRDLSTTLPGYATQDPSLPGKYWFMVTRAEVQFGLEDYKGAGNFLREAAGLKGTEDPSKASEWELQTTFRQLVLLAKLQERKLPKDTDTVDAWDDAWKALENLLGAATGPALSCYRGKVGLALSGGGFRASLFHLGVLARLAEMDVLRGVDVLSTVSGGSILGAQYYLEVAKLLRGTNDSDLKRDQYEQIIRRLITKFTQGVRYNLRTRILSSFSKNLKMLFSKKYTRSHRIGELYEEYLFSTVDDEYGRPDEGRGPGGDVPPSPRKGFARFMNDLVITPCGQPKDKAFKPSFSNWRRRAKVPILLLNTTTLNTGHSWHFTATWMGEPPGLLGKDIDKNPRYRRLYYPEAPAEFHEFRMGYAVAASSCVPALFEPLSIEGLYPDRTVRLVDGGVHDNQGIGALLDEGCTFILCSDASGQMGEVDRPGDSLLSVPLRTNSILMERVRCAELQDLQGRVESRALQGCFFVHLKKDLPNRPVNWVTCQDNRKKGAPDERSQSTPYGVNDALQRLLAGIRTDLDSFTEVEAYALMCSGYLMTKHEFEQLQKEHRRSGHTDNWGGYDVEAPEGSWPFLKIKETLGCTTVEDPKRADLELQLRVSSSLFFKAWKLYPWLKAVEISLGVLVVAALGWAVAHFWNSTLLSRTTLGGAVVVLAGLLSAILFPWIQWAFEPQKAARGILAKLALATFGFVAARLHLRIFDKLYLRRGKMDRLAGLK
jgi:predicted acylesterase/phospholipase RssA